MKLSPQSLRTYSPPEMGVTINYNHEKCPAGVDKRRRLYLTGSPHTPGLILAYCHNCGGSGAYHLDTRRPMPLTAYLPDGDSSTFEVPAYTKLPFSQRLPLGSVGLAWLMSHGLSIPTIDRYGFAHDVGTNRLYIPIYGQEDRVVKYQLRKLDLADQGPKYLNVQDYLHTPTCFDGLLYSNLSPPRSISTVVICEDVVSGLKVTQAGYDSYVLRGSNLSAEIALGLVRDAQYNTVVVWMDNDSDVIRKKAHDISEFFKLLGAKVRKIDVEADPKNYTENGIIGVMLDVIK
jgi:hypothetical protein